MSPYIRPAWREEQLARQSAQLTKPARRQFSWPALAVLWGIAGVTVGLAIGRVLWL